jgi:hypothetical protein
MRKFASERNKKIANLKKALDKLPNLWYNKDVPRGASKITSNKRKRLYLWLLLR